MSPGPEQSLSYWLQQVTMRDDIGDLRLNLLSPPLQALRQFGPRKTLPNSGSAQALVVNAGPSSDLLL